MLYDYFNKISNENKFNYFAISIVIFFLLINVIQITPTLFIGLILSAILFYFLNDKDQSNITDFNKDLEFKLSKIEPKTKFLYTDGDFINFFYNIKDFKKYNEQAYSDCVKAIDNMLLIHEDFKKGLAVYCHHHLETAQEQGKDAMNYYHSLIYKLPANNLIDNKYKKNKERLQLLIRRHIDDMYLRCRTSNEIKEIDTTGGYHIKNSGPKSDDTGILMSKGSSTQTGLTNFNYYN